MRKFFYKILLLSVALVAAGCTEELSEKLDLPESEGYEHDGKVTFTFTPNICGQNSDGTETKAFSDKPLKEDGVTSAIENIYFAVFDDNGYKLSEYAAAVPNTYAVENSPSTYSYSVELTVTDQPRIIHIIANAPDRIPYGSETEVIGALMTDFDTDKWTGDDSYWTRIYLEKGIWAQPDPSTASSDPDYATKLAKFTEVRDTLSTAKLVRNFAKITVINSAENFSPTRFWLTNVPDRGSIAPYNRNTKAFQVDYDNYESVKELMGTGSGQGNYQGFFPVTANLCSISGKSTTWLDEHAADIPGSAYCFEREIPKSDPLYVIIEGKFDSDSDKDFTDEDLCYYKIDIRDDEGDYFPVLRNFDYRINVAKVSSKGSSSVENALSMAPSGDISTSLGLQEISNISNGVSQMVVDETSKVIVGTSEGSDSFTFTYKYIPKLPSDDSTPVTCNDVLTSDSDIQTAIANKTSYLTIEYTSGATGDVFDHEHTPWEVGTTDSAEGFRTITFHPVAASEVVKTEVVTIKGHYWNPNLGDGGAWDNMERQITFRLREKLNMTLAVTPTKVPAAEGEEIDLTIGIEAGLPSSVFTLDMRIESEKLALTTNNDALPLETGTPTTGSTAKSAFSFIKAITWETYSAASTVTTTDADGNDIGYKYFTCHFKTNTATIAGNADEIYVTNKYFNTNHIGYTTYTPNTFSSVSLSPSSGVKVGDEVTLGFTLSALPTGGTVEVGLKGFEPASTETSLTYLRSEGEYEIYSYTASSTTVSGIKIVPFLEGTCAVRLGADEFTTATETATVSAPAGGFTLWADTDASDGTATDWLQPQNYVVKSNALIVGQTGTLTVYYSEESDNVTIGGLATTKGASITHGGTTLYAYTTAAGAYTSTENGTKPLSVHDGTDVLGSFNVDVYGIERGTALSNTTHSAYNTTGTGDGWYIFVNKSYTVYHLRSNGTNIVGSNASDDYNSLLGFSGAGNSIRIMVPSKSSTVYYINGKNNNTTLSMSTSGTSYTINYNSGITLSYKGNSNTRYWTQSSQQDAITMSTSQSNYTFNVYPVTFSLE